MHFTKLVALASIGLHLSLEGCGGGKKPKHQEDLLKLIKAGNADKVKEFLNDDKNKFELNKHYKFKDEAYDGETPLTYAVKIDPPNKEIIKLIAEKADRSKKNKDGKTPEELAKNDDIKKLVKKK